VEGHWLWVMFGVVVVGMLIFDTVVFVRRPHAMSLGQSLVWSLAWVSLAGCFAAAVYWQYGAEKGLEFVTGYVIEWSLSMDNLFVFLVIFTYFAVPEVYRQRVLFWGIMGAVILRGIFIAAGATLLAHFEWIMYVFGAFLVFTGLKLLRQGGEDHIEPSRNPVLRLFRRFMAVTPDYHEQRFFVRLDRHWLATPLVPVFIVIGTTDILFATDSIPAIFGITRDPFIVYSSNVFAVLGLRGLFFLLSGIMKLFCYLKVGISFVLVFVGIKMLVVDFYKIPAGASLLAVGAILGISILASLLRQPSPAVPEPGRQRLEEQLPEGPEVSGMLRAGPAAAAKTGGRHGVPGQV
jgi:TerC family integral membrane protein